MAKENVVTYKGYGIQLTGDFRFMIGGPGAEDDDEVFPSVNLAKAAIDKYIKAIARQKTAKLSVITERGQAYTITGINRHTSRLTTNPPFKKSYDEDDEDENLAFYPDVPEIKPLLEAWRKLKKQTETLGATIEKFKIKNGRYYFRMNAEDYPEQIDKLIKEYSERRKAAEQIGKPKAPKKAREILAPTEEES